MTAQRIRTLLAVTCLLLAATGVAACSGSGNSGTASQGGRLGGGGSVAVPSSIEAALESIPRTKWDSSYMEFGADADLVALNGGESGGTDLGRLLGWGDENLATYIQPNSPLEFGFDPYKEPAAVTLGVPPDTVTALYGTFDPSTVGAKLAALGFKQQPSADGGQIWTIVAGSTLGPDDSLSAIGKNVFYVSSGRVIYGGSTSEVEATATSASPRIVENSELDQLARCLGTDQVSLIGPSGSVANSTTVGLGDQITSATDVTFTICVPTGSTAAAQSLASAWAGRVATLRSKTMDELWSAELTDPVSAVLGGSANVVQLTAKPKAGVSCGLIINALQTNDLAPLLAPA